MRRPALLRRSSGGGVVLHGEGSVNYSIFLPLKRHPELFNVRRSYEVILERIALALSNQGIRAEKRGSTPGRVGSGTTPCSTRRRASSRLTLRV